MDRRSMANGELEPMKRLSAMVAVKLRVSERPVKAD